MQAKGQDTKVMLMQNGAELASFRVNNSVGINFGMSVEVRNPVGATRPELFGENSEVVVSLENEPDRPEFLTLLDLQRKANLPNSERTELKIDITTSVDFGSEGRARIGLTGGVVRNPSMSSSGRMDRVKVPIEIVFPDWRKI